MGAAFDFLRPAGGPPTSNLPQISCSGSIGPTDPVAIVLLHSGAVVLRDYFDLTHPRSVCQFPGAYFPGQLIDPHHVVIPGPARNEYALVDLPAMRFHWFQLPGQNSTLVAVGPDLDEVAWLSADLAGNTDKVHLTTNTGDQVVGSLPNPHGGRCGSADDSSSGDFTHSENLLYVLDQPIPTLNGLLVLEGTRTMLRVVPNGRWTLGMQPAMAVWSPTSETLYYRKAGSVWKWTAAGGAQVFLQGVAWYYPTISADGSHLAYAVLRSDGRHDVYLVDLAAIASPVRIGAARTRPIFLNASQIWYKSESQGPCGPGGDKSLLYDLTDNSESASIIDQPFAAWPATSSNY
jgi:hypothetical protein